MSTKGNKVVDATCIFEGGRAHTNILCTKFTGKCQRFSRFNQGNTCRTYGYEVTPFRNRKHFTMIYDKWGYNTLKSYTYSAHIYKVGPPVPRAVCLSATMLHPHTLFDRPRALLQVGCSRRKLNGT